MMHRNSFLLVDVDEDMLRGMGTGEREEVKGNGVRRAGEKTAGRHEAGKRGSLGIVVPCSSYL